MLVSPKPAPTVIPSSCSPVGPAQVGNKNKRARCPMEPKKIFMLVAAFAILLFLKTPADAKSIGQIFQNQPAASQKSRLEVPQGWKVFRGHSGLVVLHPAGWQIQERKDGGFIGLRPGSEGGPTALVVVQPSRKSMGERQGWWKGAGQIFPDLFPGWLSPGAAWLHKILRSQWLRWLTVSRISPFGGSPCASSKARRGPST